jgi:hypothetical protein
MKAINTVIPGANLESELGHFETLRDRDVEYGKLAHAGGIAALMSEEEIPQEIRDFLQKVEQGSRSG